MNMKWILIGALLALIGCSQDESFYYPPATATYGPPEYSTPGVSGGNRQAFSEDHVLQQMSQLEHELAAEEQQIQNPAPSP